MVCGGGGKKECSEGYYEHVGGCVREKRGDSAHSFGLH